MRIAIVGPGAMGCLFGALLRKAGHAVWLLDKKPERAAAIAESGVTVEEEGASRVVPVEATAEPSDLASPEMILVCVKSYDTQAAIDRALPAVGPDTTVVSLQNGAGNVEAIAAAVPPEQAVCGTTAQGSTLLGVGSVLHAGDGVTMVAPFDDEAKTRAEQVAAVLGGAGIETSVSSDAQGVIWSKLVINAAINPVTASEGVLNGALLEDARLSEIMTDAAREASRVAENRGVRLAYKDAVSETRRVCRLTAQNVSSMLQDVRRGKRTEIDAITGVIVAEGRRLGVATPVNEGLLEKIREIERKGVL